jgi:hypothetical protein
MCWLTLGSAQMWDMWDILSHGLRLISVHLLTFYQQAGGFSNLEAVTNRETGAQTPGSETQKGTRLKNDTALEAVVHG